MNKNNAVVTGVTCEEEGGERNVLGNLEMREGFH